MKKKESRCKNPSHREYPVRHQAQVAAILAFCCKIGNGYQKGKSRHIFRDFIEATGSIRITRDEIIVRFQKRANCPLLFATGFDKVDIKIP